MRLPNVIWFFVIPIIALILAVMIPVLSRINHIYQRSLCESHLKGISYAVRIYTYENNGKYPTPTQWCELVLENPGGFNEMAFWCRTEPKGTFSYAINKYLYQIDPNEVSPQTVLLFEADLGRNGIGGKEDLVLRHKEHGSLGCNITFADGHIEFVTEDHVSELRWK